MTARRAAVSDEREQQIWSILENVLDPEIPVLSIVELGIVRAVTISTDGDITVGLAPTYTGCPATEVIAADVIAALAANGYRNVRTQRILSPAWTTDWISASGRQKLLEYGIVPPVQTQTSVKSLLRNGRPLACPRCSSTDTIKVSEFGSTPCKASYKCGDCLEPFEYFKCI